MQQRLIMFQLSEVQQWMGLTSYTSFASLKRWIYIVHQIGLWAKENRIAIQRKLWKENSAKLEKIKRKKVTEKVEI